jgi:hypothetical protein
VFEEKPLNNVPNKDPTPKIIKGPIKQTSKLNNQNRKAQELARKVVESVLTKEREQERLNKMKEALKENLKDFMI